MNAQATPVRYIAAPHTCGWCGVRIPRCGPGHAAHTRGTKAFLEANGEWLCILCHDEQSRYEAASDAAAIRAGSK